MKIMGAAMLALALPALMAASAPITGGVTEQPTGPIRHRLTLVSAYSCTYCRVLDMNGMATLRSRWLPRGLQIETVPFILSTTDIPASIAARCGPAGGFARRSTILFRAQSQIAGDWMSISQAKRDVVAKQADPIAIARLSGIDEMGPSLGLTKQTLQSCLSDPARRRAVESATNDAVSRLHVAGTPTAFLDGRKIAASWPAIDSDIAAVFR